MPRLMNSALITALAALTLVGCATSTDQGTRVVDDSSSTSDLRFDGTTWSAEFPGDVVQEQQPFPVEGVGEFTADLTYWETADEVILVQIVNLPPGDGDAAANLLNTGTNLGTVVPDSPLLDSNGTFRGLPALVVEAEQDGALLKLLAFVDDTTLYQLMHVKSAVDTPDRLPSFVSTFELR